MSKYQIKKLAERIIDCNHRIRHAKELKLSRRQVIALQNQIAADKQEIANLEGGKP